MASQNRDAAVGAQSGYLHDYGYERYGSDEGAFDEPVGQEERNHDRPDASQQGGEKTEHGAHDGEGAARESHRAACPGAPVDHHADQKNSQETRQKRKRSRSEEKTADQRGGYAGQREPT